MFDRLPVRRRIVVVLLPVLLALLIGIGVFLASRDDNQAPATPTAPEPSVISPP